MTVKANMAMHKFLSSLENIKICPLQWAISAIKLKNQWKIEFECVDKNQFSLVSEITLNIGKYHFKSLSNLLLASQSIYVCDIYNVVIVMSRTVRGTVQTIFLTPKSVFILRSNMILSEPVNWYIVVCWGGGGGGTVSYVVQRTFHIRLPLLTCSTSYMYLGNYKTQTGFEVCLNDQCRLTLSVQVDRMTVILTV